VDEAKYITVKVNPDGSCIVCGHLFREHELMTLKEIDFRIDRVLLCEKWDDFPAPDGEYYYLVYVEKTPYVVEDPCDDDFMEGLGI